ncbi:MAG: SDR family oxidoreductase [Bryobacterales bacterium]|nr:SDR family oxidoreductase [Bryobacterales bacterium]
MPSGSLQVMLGTFRRHRRHPVETVRRDLAGLHVVFSGGTDGMGRVAVGRLAQMNANIHVLGRNPEKTARTVDELNRAGGGGRAAAVPCDLSSLSSVRACAAMLLEQCPRIDVLINCAGTNAWERRMSADGHEMNWAVNYLGPFLLTQLLLERIKASVPARIVNLSSETEMAGHIHFDDLRLARNWTALRSYAQAKLATNMATIALARRLDGTGVTVNALNPGFIRTALLRDIKGAMQIWKPLMNWLASPAEVGAERILMVALSPKYEGVNGQYVHEDAVRQPNPEALDDAAVERLWEITEKAVRT